MKPVEQIRRENLRALADQLGGVARLSEKTEKSSSQLSQWLNASPNSKTGKPRTVSHKSARLIEQKLGLPENWMDHEHDVSTTSGDRHITVSDRAHGDDEVVTGDLSVDDLLQELRSKLMDASPEIRDDVARLVTRYMTGTDESIERIAQAIRALLDDEDGNTGSG